MITVDLEETIHRPIEVVWDYLQDEANAPKWQPAVTEQRITSAGPLSLGSTGVNVRQVMGRRLETTWEVTEYTSNQHFAVKSTSGPVSYHISYTLEPADGGTRLRVQFQGDPKGVFKLAEPLLAGSLKKEFAEDNARLKDILESQTP